MKTIHGDPFAVPSGGAIMRVQTVDPDLREPPFKVFDAQVKAADAADAVPLKKLPVPRLFMMDGMGLGFMEDRMRFGFVADHVR